MIFKDIKKRDSFQSKIMVLIVALAIFGIMATVSINLVRDFYKNRAKIVELTTSVANVVGLQAISTLEFNDIESAKGILTSGSSGSIIQDLCLYDLNDSEFARFSKETSELSCPDQIGKGHSFVSSKLFVWHSIERNGSKIGTLYISSSTEQLYDAIIEELIFVFGMSIGIIIFTLLVASKTLKSLIRPIFEMGHIASDISSTKDYSLRVERHKKDEIGVLADLINQMLEEIEQRDKDLVSSQQELANLNQTLQDKVHQRTLSLKATIDELVETREKAIQSDKLASLGTMAAGIAHEINNPLAIIEGNATLADFQLSKGEVDEVRERMARIVDSTERITDIVNSIRMFSGQREEDALVNYRVQKLITRVLSMCEARITSKGIKIEMGQIPEKLNIPCRPVDVCRIIFSLLENSEQELSKTGSGWIKIDCVETNSHVDIRITDSGSGIEKSLSNKIFDPFFTMKPVGQGQGLGLSLAKSLALEHDGELSLDDKSKNTCFVLKLPKFKLSLLKKSS
jgi:signal transduction histidine kinase